MAHIEHVAYCFDTICSATGVPIPNSSVKSSRSVSEPRPTTPVYPSPVGLDAKAWNDSFPLFVSWHKKDNADAKTSRLRGCIGCFSPMELASGLRDYAMKSALEDTRFSPVTAREVPLLECQVSLLLNFTPANDCYDWTVGTHGVRIEFTANGRRYSSTYLPEIATDQGWTKEKTIQSLVAKSGYSKTASKAILDSIKLTRYESRTAQLTWAEYVAHRSSPPPPAAATPSPTPAPAAVVAPSATSTSKANGTNGHTNGHSTSNGHSRSNGNGAAASFSSSSTVAAKKPPSPPATEPATKKRGVGV